MAHNKAHCLSLSSTKLPDNVIKDITERGNPTSLKTHIKNLQAESKSIQDKYADAVKIHNTEALKATPAYAYTNRPTDPTNELNKFKPSSLDKLKANMIQRYGSIKQALNSVFTDNELTENDIAVLGDFVRKDGFSQQFNHAFNSIYKKTNNLYYRYKDLTQYFPDINAKDQNQFDSVFMDAVSSASYEWLHTESPMALGQTPESLKRMFGLSKDDHIPEAMGAMLMDLGVNRDMLADQIGRTVLDRINIEAIKSGEQTAYADASAKMIRSFGYMAIATMENMTYSDGKLPLIKRQEVYVRAVDALKSGLDFRDSTEVFYDPSDEQRALDNDITQTEYTGKKGNPTRKFIKLNTNQENVKGRGRHDIHTDLIDAKTLLRSAPDAFDKVFGTTPVVRTISWKRIVLNAKEKVGKLGTANIFQIKNLQKSVNVPYVKSVTTTNAFNALTGTALDIVVGVESMDGKLDIRSKSVEGINRGIQRDLDAIRDQRQAEEARNKEQGTEGQNTPFYIPARFQAQHRMLQTGFNPQGSKLVRNLFSPEAFNIEFNPLTDTETNEAFLQSIALAFDVETIKVGGVDNQLSILDSKLENKRIAAAIKVLQEFHKTGEMSEDQQMTVALGVKETKTKLHGLKGLVEYARYDSYMKDTNPNKGSFTTDMYDENDGVSNGVVFAALMFIPDSAISTPEKAAELLSIAAMGGISVDRKKTIPNLDKLISQKNLNDAYQNMGQQWAITEQRNKLQLSFDSNDPNLKESDRKKAQKTLEQFMAIESLLGRFTESTDADGNIVNDGVINKVIRSLSKPRTMQTVYRAGIKTQNRILATENVIDDGIYSSLEKIIQRIESATKDEVGLLAPYGAIHLELIKLFDVVAKLTNNHNNLNINNYSVGGLIDPAELKKFKLSTDQIEDIVQATMNTYGGAMKEAIDKVYSHIIAASKPFTALMERAASTYNFVLKSKVAAAIAANDKILLADHQKAIDDLEQTIAATTDKVEKAKLRKNTKIPSKQALQQQLGRLTVTELKAITDSIAHLIPKIKTPMHTDEHPSYLYLAKLGSVKDNSELIGEDAYSPTATVEQNYAGGTPKNKGYVTTIPYLASVGASGFVKSVQMMDAMHANHIMGLEGVDLLSIHDGFVHGIKDSKAIAESINQYFRDTLFGSDTKPAYSIGAELWNMHTEMAKESSLLDMLLENNVSVDEIIDYYSQHNLITSESFDSGFPGIPDKADSKARLAFLKHINEYIDSDAESMAKQVTRNKQTLGDAVTHTAQYPHNGTGISSVSKSTDTKVFGVDRNKVLDISRSKADEIIAESVRINDMGISGSSATGISNDTNDYSTQSPDTRIIDAKNNLEVFDTILTMDSQAGSASIQNSDEHIADLKRILHDIVNKVMKPVTFYMAQYQGQNDETRGEYDPNNATIWLQRQQVGQPTPGMLGQGIRMSAAVVYAHELIHHITTFGLKNDPRTARQISDLYETTREALETKYGNNAFKVFLNEALETDADLYAYLNDAANANEIIAAKARWDYLFNPIQNANKTNRGLDEFVAFGMTDENFKRELSQLAVDPRIIAKRKSLLTVFEKNLQTTLVNIYNIAMDFIQNMFHSQKHSPMVAQEIENLVIILSKIDTKGKNLIFNATANAEAKATAFSLTMDDKVKDLAVKTMNKTKLGAAMNKLKTLPELNNMLSHQMRVALLWYKDQEQGLLPAVFNEMKGTTERLRGLHALLSNRNMTIDAAKEEIAATMSAVNRGWFDRKLNTHEKIAITKVFLKGDISSLLDTSSLDAIRGFIESPSKRDAQIVKLTADLRVLINGVTKNTAQRNYYMTFFEGGVNDLGHAMVTGEGFVEGVNYRNANNLAFMDGSRYEGVLANSESFTDIVNILDQLSSLSSLKYMSYKDKTYASKLMATNPEAVKNVLINHKNLQRQAADELFGGRPELMEKGYVKTILNSRIQFEQGTLADEQAFADRGFIRHARPFKRDNGATKVDPVTDDIYMYISHNGTINDYLSGIASTTRNKKKGATHYDIEQQLGNQTNPAIVADANNKLALAAIRKKADNMGLSSVRTKRKDGTNAMMPSFNNKGKMSTLRYVMSEHIKDTVLQQFSDFDVVLGSMAAQIVDKVNTPVINSKLVIELREMWDKEKTQLPEAYVKIGPESSVKRYRDIYAQFPQKMKDQILSEWGSNSMMVSQDVVDLAFGQRKYSITELFGKNPAERGTFERLTMEALTFALGFHNPLAKNELESIKGRAVTRAKSIEDFMIQLTKLAKGNVIVRNIRVTWGNHLSNVMYLKNKGIPLKDIMLLQREAFTSALQYQADNDKLQTLRIKRDTYMNDNSISAANRDIALRNVDRAIMRLEHLLANNPSTEMIKAGLLPSIIEDLDAAATHKPHRFGLDKVIETGLNKLPEKVGNLGRVVFMTEDSEGFKTLNNMVKMTDYVGRYVLYKHYTKKGMDKAEAMSRVQNEFINFAPPTHRMIEYANAIGVIWFSKYLLRVQKHIKNNVTERPFTTLATFLISSATHGNNIMESVPFLTKDMSQILGDPLVAMTSSIGGISTLDTLDTLTPNF